MTITAESPSLTAPTGTQQFATFYVGDLLLGVDIRQVQEINRQLEVTPVPGAPPFVRGVINLRGEVATVINLRTVLDLPHTGVTRETRNLIVHFQGEAIGLLVDRISDILTVRGDEMSPPPSNLNGVDGRFFTGVYATETELVVILDIEQALNDRRSE